MRKIKIIIPLILVLSLISSLSYALIVHDPIGAVLNRLRNIIMNNHYIQMVRNALMQFEELKRIYGEMARYQSGIDNIFRHELLDFRSLKDFGQNPADRFISDLGYELNSIIGEVINITRGRTTGYSGMKSTLEHLFGADPRSPERPYISYQEVQVADSLVWAGEVRRVAEQTKMVGQMISNEAALASPKGATRLSADALGKLLITQAQIQQNQSKIIELEANQLELETMEEKRLERERLKYMRDFQEVLADIKKL